MPPSHPLHPAFGGAVRGTVGRSRIVGGETSVETRPAGGVGRGRDLRLAKPQRAGAATPRTIGRRGLRSVERRSCGPER